MSPGKRKPEESVDAVLVAGFIKKGRPAEHVRPFERDVLSFNSYEPWPLD